MKAWEELVLNPHISLGVTLTSEYYIGKGVKIERFTDGRFELNNIMSLSETYYPLTHKEYMNFENRGWDYGCLTVNVNTFTERIERAECRLKGLSKNREEDISKCLRTISKYEKKLKEITDRLDKLYPSLLSEL